MRSCPICEEADRKVLGAYEGNFELMECLFCGHRYLDGNYTQSFFNGHYSNDTSPDLQDALSVKRLVSLADTIGPFTRGLDIGGKWSPLQRYLKVETLNAGEQMTGLYDLFILSHTLEHVYDVHGLMDEIKAHSADNARIVIEGPIWPDDYDKARPDYDYHWQHVNKFRLDDLKLLLYLNEFSIVEYTDPGQFLDYDCLRVVGVRYAVC